jgi:hypothetical protein
MRRAALWLWALMAAWLLAEPLVWGQGHAAGEAAALAEAVIRRKVSLLGELSASTCSGEPLSARFALQDGTLHLSVYTVQGNTFSKVMIDPWTRKIVTVKPITSGNDLAAVNANQGFRVVSVTPTLTEGHPVAEVALVKDDTVKTVAERLDE